MKLLQFWEDSLVRIVNRGIRRGEIKEDADIETFVAFFISMIEGSLMLSKVTGDRKYIGNAVTGIEEYINTRLRT